MFERYQYYNIKNNIKEEYLTENNKINCRSYFWKRKLFNKISIITGIENILESEINLLRRLQGIYS